MHFFNPVPLMKLVEVIRSLVTSDETAETVKAFGESLGKTAVIAKDTPVHRKPLEHGLDHQCHPHARIGVATERISTLPVLRG